MFLLASRDDQLRCVCTRFTAGQADGSGVVSCQRQSERSIACDQRGDIHRDPGAAAERSNRADLGAERRSGVIGDAPFAPACIRHRIHLASGRATAVGVDPELGAGNGCADSLYVEGQIAIYNRADVKTDLL